MKKTFFRLCLVLFCLITFHSCSKEDTYTNLSGQAKELLLYESGDAFKLKNTITDEIIELTVSLKNFDYYRDTNPGWWLGSSGGDDFYEYGEYYFTDVTNCYTGSIRIEARSSGNFELIAFLGDCFVDLVSSLEYDDEITSTIINEITYQEAYVLNSLRYTMFYTKEKGIIKIMKNRNEETIFSIYE